ncbi:MAG TPA: CDP-alcohol phosphatidyltransferase family protein [Sphingobium sp.]
MSRVTKPVDRIQTNLLASAERRLLNWMCARLPRSITPDDLTALGFFGALVIAAGYILSAWNVTWLWLSILGYVIHWVGDSLDGSVARYRQIERPKFGYFIDHSTDALANLIYLSALGATPFIRLDVALLGLIGYFMLSIHAFLAARVVGEMRLSYLAGGPTELRLILITMTLLMIFVGNVPTYIPNVSAYDLFVLGVASLMIALFVIQTTNTAKALIRRGEE